ncbi:MAG TPA: replicative DNA helicase [Candidatus Dormibacteraeota bacterium]|nr:replicative DNA helicase [Candidatus Dormibacteraeota bacterium]
MQRAEGVGMTTLIHHPGETLAGRVPPHDGEAEQSVLGALMLDPEAVSHVRDILDLNDFYEERHAHIYRAAVDLSDRGEPIDIVTLRNELERNGSLSRSGGVDYIAELSLVTPAATSVRHYAEIVIEHAVRRRLIRAGGEIAGFGFDDSLTAEEATDRAEQRVFTIATQRRTTEASHIAPVLKDTWSQLESLLGRRAFVTGVPTNFGELDKVTQGLQPGELIILAARPSVGKALALDTPIATPAGWTTMGDLRAGDRVFDERGMPCTVTFATDVMHGRDCFEVEFSDRSVLVADADHLWATNDRASRKRGDHSLSVRTTRELLASLRTAGGRANHLVPACGALQRPERELPVDPYALGVWLGDGTSTSATVTVSDADSAILEEIQAGGISVKRCSVSGSRTPMYRLGSGGRGGVQGGILDGGRVTAIRAAAAAGATQRALAAEHGVSPAAVCLAVKGRTWKEAPGEPSLQARLRALGLIGNKHIPRAYLETSVEQRTALLQGLMDSDGHVRADGLAEFTSTSAALAGGVVELATSLGIVVFRSEDRARLHGVDMGPRHRVTFTTSTPVCRLERKRARLRRIGLRKPSRSRRIHDIRQVPSVPVRCITVDSPSRLYLAGRACIPTHNTSFALNVARNASVLAKQPVVVFSLEMSKDALVQRLLCSEAAVDAFLLKTGQADANVFQRIAHALNRLMQADLWIDDTPGLSITSLRARARRMKAQHDIKLVVVDYLQLMRGGRTESRVQEVSDISAGLKSIAKELAVPVLALSQLSRESERRTDRRPQLSDLRDSGSIEQDADIVLFLYREGMHNTEIDRSQTKLIVGKNRNGPIGDIDLLFVPEQTSFREPHRGRGEG